MSDMPGLALAIGAKRLLLRRDSPEPRGSLIERRGLFGSAIARRASRGHRHRHSRSVGRSHGSRPRDSSCSSGAIQSFISRSSAFICGGLAWGIPLVIASGGISAYLAALHTQAAEDFSWVDMLWSNPTPRHIAIGLYQALVLPWASIPLALAVGVAAAVGLLVTLLESGERLLVLSVAFVPYFVFHLLFQQLDTVRYALPLVVPVAWLAARKLRACRTVFIGCCRPVRRRGADRGRRREESPTAANRIRRSAPLPTRCSVARVQPPAAVYSHYAVRVRPCRLPIPGRCHVVEPPTQHEWLGPVDYWREGGAAPVWFLADQRRTDLALIDPHSRNDVVRYRWDVEQRPELGGTRPLGVDWYRLGVPGWFAGQGWSLTPETGGITQATISGTRSPADRSLGPQTSRAISSPGRRAPSR